MIGTADCPPRTTQTLCHGRPRQLGRLPGEHAGRGSAARLVDGVDIIETDLHLTVDGAFVLHPRTARWTAPPTDTGRWPG